jgi:hypothetical protein
VEIDFNEKPVQIASGGSAPQLISGSKDWTRPVKYQVSAKAGNTDGEESLLLVVTNRVLITETLPLPIKANETRTFDPCRINIAIRPTILCGRNDFFTSLVCQQALPYLMEFPHECAEQTFSRLYATTLAAHIANKYPAIKQVYDAWNKQAMMHY